MLPIELNRKGIIVTTICFIAFMAIVSTFAFSVNKLHHVGDSLIEQSLISLNIGTVVPEMSVVSSEEYEQFISISPTASFSDYSVYSTQASTGFSQETSHMSATGANAELYNLADSWFQCYYGTQRVSPILPLAIANVETPGRADNSITWSALFPSKYIDVSLMSTADITTVVSDRDVQLALSKEVSTRDRGALQMSPTYGTSDSYFNSLMTGTEKDKLKDVETGYCSSWASGASDKAGDRFCVQDVCLRLSSAMTQGITFMARNDYLPQNDMQLIAQCAMHHHNSGIWYHNDRNTSVGAWKSAGKAYDYSTMISSQDFITLLSEYASYSNSCYIDGNVAKRLYSQCFDIPMTDFATKEIVCTYPIKVMYAYIKLCMLYTQ